MWGTWTVLRESIESTETAIMSPDVLKTQPIAVGCIDFTAAMETYIWTTHPRRTSLS